MMRGLPIRPLFFAAFVATLLIALMVYQRDNLAAGYDNVVDKVKSTAASAADAAADATKNLPLPFSDENAENKSTEDSADNKTEDNNNNNNNNNNNGTPESNTDGTTENTADKTESTKVADTTPLFGSDAVPQLQKPVDNYISVCLAIKDQRLDLPEFLHHHYYNMGVGHFFIMDDGSEPPLSEMTEEELTIPKDAIEFHYYTPKEHVRWMQYTMYNACIKLARNESKAVDTTWMAFIDADEYIDAPGPQTLREVLEDFSRIEAIGSVALNWRIHSSNGHLTRQPSTIAAYTECIYDDPEHNGNGTNNRHVKSIVKVDLFKQPRDPHSFYLLPGHITVGEHGDVVPEFLRSPITRDKLALHHYAVKSKAEYEEKMARGSGMSNHKGWDIWELYETKNPHVPCPEMLRWAPKTTEAKPQVEATAQKP
ncbi:hypothetical protein SBRCBS47491_004253 [Sporothrix bragantina]|uniref:Glycosyltransferase family 92 protein n=1 Tax=Sporothrix bragantina TaxID=671064 RepID=A0ABP0BLZ8_9PEZI